MASADRSQQRELPTAIPRDSYDVAIVGAGVSGLAVAALLARTGRSVLVLESINYPGGCASSYRAESAWFDIGATTFCGADPGQPLSLLFSEIGTFPDLLPAQPTLSAVLGGSRIDLTTDRKEWTRRLSASFDRDQSAFWHEMFSVSDAVYRAVRSAPYLPPVRPAEFIRNLPAASSDLIASLPALFSTVQKRMRHHAVDTPAFRRFVDAQLLITNQTVSDDAFVINGALGLTYANGKVYSVKGGMIAFPRFLEARATSFGADVAYLQRVTGIEQNDTGWTVRTAKRQSVHARTVVTQVPLWNLPAMTTGPVRAHFNRMTDAIARRGVSQWGAVTLYALVPDTFPRSTSLNTQIILDKKLPTLGSETLFCTLSHPDDDVRCPRGFRTLSVSTHVAPDWLPVDLDPDAYRSLKDACAAEILSALRRSVPEFDGLRPEFTEVGTPKTFRKYTGRHEGLVGGIPLSRRLFPWKYPKPVTPFPGLFTIGDTFFPGQGIPGVVLGALGVYRRMLRSER